MSYLKVKVSFTSSTFDTRGLVKLGKISGYDLALSSWWSSLAAKLTVSVRMDLVEDMNTDKNSLMIPNTLGMPFTLLYLY